MSGFVFFCVAFVFGDKEKPKFPATLTNTLSKLQCNQLKISTELYYIVASAWLRGVSAGGRAGDHGLDDLHVDLVELVAIRGAELLHQGRGLELGPEQPAQHALSRRRVSGDALVHRVFSWCLGSASDGSIAF